MARSVRTLVDDARTLIARTRRDVSATFPDALDRISADGMLTLALLRVQMLPLLAGASASTLLDTYVNPALAGRLPAWLLVQLGWRMNPE